MMDKVLFECRGCGNGCWGDHVGPHNPSWGEIVSIDGPHHVCGDCLGDPELLASFHEDGYPEARYVPRDDR